MRPGSAVGVAAAAALSLGVAVEAARVARALDVPRIEMGRAKLTRLTDETRRRLATLQDKVLVTYYASDRARMPSDLRRVEREVSDLLDALHRASGGKLDWHLVDPGAAPDAKRGEDLSKFASRRGVAPFRARSVEHDAYSEQTVWSTLAIAYGARPEARIPGVGPEHVERLQSLLVSHLDAMERPRRPVVALAAPPGYEQVRAAIAAKADVRNVDFDGGAPLPDDADALFWMEPRSADDARLNAIERFARRGRGVVIAGSERAAEVGVRDGRPAALLRPTGMPAAKLLARFGMRPVEGLLVDERTAKSGAGPDGVAPPPFDVLCIAYDQDFRTLRTQPNGNLLFRAPTPLALDADALAERGWTADVLATTSDKTHFHPLHDAIPIEELAPDRGELVAKQPLVVRLRPRDPWEGSIFVFAAPTPFQDGGYSRSGVAHERLLKTLLDEIVSVDRLVANQVGALRLPPLPPLGSGERLFWRFAAVGLFPIALLGIAFGRGAFRKGGAPRVERARRAIALPAAAALAGAVALAVAATAFGGARADLTQGASNELSAPTRAIAARARGEGAIRAELLFSAAEKLPPEMKPWTRRIAHAIDDLRRAGAEIALVRTDPDDLDAAAREALATKGVEPIRVTTQDEEVTTVRTVFAALRLQARGREEWLRFADAVSLENLEFRLAFALRRLETGRRPIVALATDVPRPTPAEQWEWQQAGSVSPTGTDVYSLARKVLADCDYDVRHVNPHEPKLPEAADAIVWLQPRRDACAMYEALANHLARGGRALLAAQHYVMQARQYRGTGFKLVYWPQPQFNDVDFIYFPEIGVELVPEVLFDELKTRVAAETQVNRAYARPDVEVQTSALPFLIRASSAHFARDSSITRELGDQAFLNGAYFRFDRAKMESFGLHARPLVTTSERTWTFAWKGSWIPENVLEGPPHANEGEPAWRGRLPLAVEIEGSFPAPTGSYTLPSLFALASQPAASRPALVRPADAAAKGRLVMLGSSELLKNHRILDREFRADHLLLNAVASLALEPDLAEIAAHRPVARGFDFVAPETKLRWRAFAVAGAPGLLVLFGLARWIAGRRRIES